MSKTSINPCLSTFVKMLFQKYRGIIKYFIPLKSFNLNCFFVPMLLPGPNLFMLLMGLSNLRAFVSCFNCS